MRTNITLSIEAELVTEVKVMAARRGVSVSKLLAQGLEDLIRQDRDYEAASRSALARLDRGFNLGWTRPASRGELHER